MDAPSGPLSDRSALELVECDLVLLRELRCGQLLI